jgi:CRP-like cAMP-binding protein
MDTIIIEEGKLSNLVIIVKSGEFEVTKRNLT